jgi:hypothetical protein
VLLRKCSTTILVIASMLGALSLAGPAQADTWSHADRAHDVARLKFTKADFAVKPARGDRTTDITRLTVTHSAQRVTLRIKMRDLTNVDLRSTVALIKTPTRPYIVAVESIEFAFVGKQMGRCPRLQKNFDYQANLITIAVPRRCLGNPNWVRVGVLAETQTGALLSANGAPHLDDALSNKLASFESRPHLGPKIRR